MEYLARTAIFGTNSNRLFLRQDKSSIFCNRLQKIIFLRSNFFSGLLFAIRKSNYAHIILSAAYGLIFILSSINLPNEQIESAIQPAG